MYPQPPKLVGTPDRARPLTRDTEADKNRTMTACEAISRLCEHRSELNAAGIVRLSVFGSTARGDRHPNSDIDLLAAFDQSRRISLPAVAGLELRLADLLGQPVDLVEEGTLKPLIQKTVEAEVLHAF